jgi:protein phosphatase
MAITHDHSFCRSIDQGLEEARYSLNRNLVTRAVGVDDKVEPEIHVLCPGGRCLSAVF